MADDPDNMQCVVSLQFEFDVRASCSQPLPGEIRQEPRENHMSNVVFLAVDIFMYTRIIPLRSYVYTTT